MEVKIRSFERFVTNVQINSFWYQKYVLGIVGLSTSAKPTNIIDVYAIASGSYFLEMDTGKVWFYDESTSTWLDPEA